MESPEQGAAEIWYLWPDRVTNPARLAEHAQLLSEDERLQNQAFHFPEHRHSYLLTRAFVRTLLSRYGNVNPSEWRFARTPFGKPEIAGPSGAAAVNFSLSHTAGLIVCAISSDSPIGVDAEHLERATDYMEIAQRYFSPAEYRSLQESAATERRRRFLEYWTLKESYVKARGLGLSIDLSRFAFQIDGRNIRITFAAPDVEDSAAWQFQLLSPGGHHVVAVSIRCTPGVTAKFIERDGTALME